MWTPRDGVVDLNAVEQALHTVELAKMTPEQKKASTRVVSDVEHVVAQLNSDRTLSKAQRMEKAKGAIQELQGLQSQWELAAVESSMKKLADLSHLSSEQRAEAKKVVADVDATVEDIEAGKLTGAAQTKRVGHAIQELQALQRDWLNTSTVSKVEALKREIAAKKALMKKDEIEIKMINLEKELAEKKLLLKKLTAQKDQAREVEKQRKEDATQEAMVSKLLATAKALAASRKPHAAAPQPKAAGLAADPAIGALVAQLQAQERNMSASIQRMDAEAKAREAKLSLSIEAGAKAPTKDSSDATLKAATMMKGLLKEEHRKYLKARALKESERQELLDGIHSIQKGDTAALARLMQQMEKESKSLQAKTKGFLY